jgi:hypothetical protein
MNLEKKAHAKAQRRKGFEGNKIESDVIDVVCVFSLQPSSFKEIGRVGASVNGS